MRIVACTLAALVSVGTVTAARAQSVGQVIDHALGGRTGYNQREAYEQGRFDGAHDEAWRRREWHHRRHSDERHRWEQRERSAYYYGR